MEFLIAIMIMPLVLFIIFVAPIWLLFHYLTRRKSPDQSTGATEADKKKIEELLHTADRLETRLRTLEAILDRQEPDWRKEL